jgi:hypothetical protein
MPRSVDMVTINFLTQARAVGQAAFEHGGKVIPPNAPLKPEGFRPLTQPETLKVTEKIIVIGIAVVAGGAACRRYGGD